MPLMGVYQKRVSLRERDALTAINAGVDILLMPTSVEATVSALIAAVENGDIPLSRIDESVMRILGLKISRGIM